MLDQLQDLLAQFEDQEEQIAALQAANLQLVVEREDLLTRCEFNDKAQRALSRVPALENSIARLTKAGELKDAEIKELRAKVREKSTGDDPVKLRKTIKNQKSKIEELRNGVDGLKKMNADYRNEAKVIKKKNAELASIVRAYGMKIGEAGAAKFKLDGYDIMLWSEKVRFNADGKEYEDQIALHFMDSTGLGGLVFVIDDHICYPTGYQIAHGGKNPIPDSVAEWMENWLRKIKRQNGEILVEDIEAFSPVNEQNIAQYMAD